MRSGNAHRPGHEEGGMSAGLRGSQMQVRRSGRVRAQRRGAGRALRPRLLDGARERAAAVAAAVRGALGYVCSRRQPPWGWWPRPRTFARRGGTLLGALHVFHELRGGRRQREPRTGNPASDFGEPRCEEPGLWGTRCWERAATLGRSLPSLLGGPWTNARRNALAIR
jgi:hypothetical protein